MNSDWRQVSIKQVCERITSGGTPRSTEYAYYEGGTIPWLTTSEVNYNIIRETERHITPLGLENSAAKVVPQDTVIVAMYGRGTAGRVAMAGKPLTTNQACCNLIIDQTIANPRYVFYALWHDFARLDSLATGSVQQNLSARVISDFEIYLPPLREQDAIASMLGALDDKIELNRRMTETLEEILRESHRDWFSSSNAKLLQDSSEAALTSSWAPGSVGDLAYEKREGVNPSMMAPDTPYIGLEHMPRRRITLDMWGTAEGLGSNKYHFERGDILFGKLRPYFHKVGVAPVDGICSTDMVVVVAKEKAYASFLLGVISSDEFVQFTDSSSTGTRMPRTSWKTMASYPIRIPPLALAHAYNDFAEPIIARTINATFENKTLAELRDTLLPKLISGELRVPQAEQLVSEVV